MEAGVGLIVAMLVVVGLLFAIPPAIRSLRRNATRAATVVPPQARTPTAYDWDRRTHQVYRKFKGIDGPNEQRDQILAFIDGHEGVEAYVEPRTVMHPLSVVLVDADGVWRRFELAEDAFLRDLARDRHLKVVDAMRYGYPQRMRRDQGKPPPEA